MRMPGILMLAAILLVTGLAEPRSVQAVEPIDFHPMATAGPVALLSYNVEGLPWPLTHGRTAAAAAIAENLRERHARDGGPQVVAVQEAFGDAQKAIGLAAGYRYAAFGPTADLPAASATTPAQHAFLADASLWHGETETPREDSGLAIFSDYPILWVRRMAYPRFACAGYDCLANKGVLAVALRVPGQRQPLIVVDTHLNARAASGVAAGRSLTAYRWQADRLASFLNTIGTGGAPMVLAGDFNVGNDPARQQYLSQALLGASGMTLAGSETTCGSGCRTVAPVPTFICAKTILSYRGTGRSIAPLGSTGTFGITSDGRHLSDHVGVIRRFDLDS